MRAMLLALVGVAVGMAGWSPIGAEETKQSGARPNASGHQSDNADRDQASETAPVRPAAPAGKKTATAVFAGGCFWCTEFAFEQIAGVVNVESGYCGGTKASASYHKVHLGTTRHAEAIRVTYDPDKITYDALLDVFFNAHDPTQLNRQGEEDVGRQYRSAIFFANDEQQKQANAKIAELKAKRVYKRRIVTKLEPLKEFFRAEEIHQDFARKNPDLPYIQNHAIPKASHVQAKHPDLIRHRDESPEVRSLLLRPGS